MQFYRDGKGTRWSAIVMLISITILGFSWPSATWGSDERKTLLTLAFLKRHLTSHPDDGSQKRLMKWESPIRVHFFGFDETQEKHLRTRLQLLRELTGLTIVLNKEVGAEKFNLLIGSVNDISTELLGERRDWYRAYFLSDSEMENRISETSDRTGCWGVNGFRDRTAIGAFILVKNLDNRRHFKRCLNRRLMEMLGFTWRRTGEFHSLISGFEESEFTELDAKGIRLLYDIRWRAGSKFSDVFAIIREANSKTEP